MGTSITVSEIMEEARVRLSYPAFSATTFITDTAALNLMKFSARRLGAMLRRAYGSDYFTETTTLSTQANINFVSLPTNFSDLRQIAWLRSTNDSVPLEKASVDDWLAAGERIEAWTGAPRYRLMSEAIMLYPCPSQVYTLSLYYDTGIFVTATTDAISVQPGWEEWLVNDFCVRVRQAEELDAADFVRERSVSEDAILKEAAMRDRFRMHTIREEYCDGDGIDNRSLYWRR